MNILVIAPFPPMACGIGKYAEQQVRFLRREGHNVDVLSPPEGGGDFRVNLHGGARVLRLLRTLWAYDEACIHFAPQFFFNPERRFDRIVTSLAMVLLAALAGRRLWFIIHETSYKIGQPSRGPLRHRIDRLAWAMAGRIVFHSARERDAFADFYRLDVRRRQFEIWPHEKYMTPACTLTRNQARARLALSPEPLILLCIGFIQPHKGFDRLLRALTRVPEATHLSAHIVGSVRLAWDVAHAYAQQLYELADADPRAEIHEGYLSDELFDAWLLAADYVVIPYHEIWTSGVAAHAKICGRPLIVSDTGGLSEQLTPGSLLFRDDDELVELLRGLPEPNRSAAAFLREDEGPSGAGAPLAAAPAPAILR